MRSASPGLAALVAAIAASIPLHAAGSVWIVGPPGPGVDFQQVSDAVAAAAAADIVVIRSGTYASFALTGKSLHLVADVGATVRFDSGLVVTGLAASDVFVLRGLELRNTGTPPHPGSATALSITGSSSASGDGLVWVEDCLVRGGVSAPHPFGFPGASSPAIAGVVGARMLVTRCDVLGGWAGSPPQLPRPGSAGIQTSGVTAPLFVYDSNVRGADATAPLAPGGSIYPSPGGAGIVAPVVLLSGATVHGGAGSPGYATSTSCAPGGPGSVGIGPGFPSTGVILEVGSAIAGGSGGNAFLGCPKGDDAAATSSPLVSLGAIARSSAIGSPVRVGQSTLLAVSGAAGDFVVVAFAPIAHPSFLPSTVGALVPSAPLGLAPIGSLPASGQLQLAVPIGPPPPDVEGATLFVQSAFLEPLTATAFLGSPSALAILDASL